MNTLVTGGTGFVGSRLFNRLSSPTIVTRNRVHAVETFGSLVGEAIEWSPMSGTISLPKKVDFNVVVNLMGESIAEGRWTAAKKRRIRDSRVIGTRNLVDSLIQSDCLPEVFISGSAVGYYGNSGEEIVTESHPVGQGFLPDVCQAWEAEADRLLQHNVRVVKLRIGIVLGSDGGALKKLIPIFRTGLGGKLGSGKQWMPWIHVDDLVSMILWTMGNQHVSGPINAVAPVPVRNEDFTKTLAAAVHRPAFLPVPRFGLRLALGEFADSLLCSQRVVPAAASQKGFNFQFADLISAVDSVVRIGTSK